MTDAPTTSGTIHHPLPGTSRYELVAKIASGGMAVVYVGRLRGAAGFSRQCAIKRAHPHLVEDPELRRSLVAEARLASRIQHPNVVSISDVEELEGELLLVMDYVEGAALSELLRHANDAGRRLAPRAVVRIALDACAGLGAAHDLRDDAGAPLGIVHRDVSPQNVLVGADGIARIVDFGIAKSRDVGGASGKTMTGVLKGKVGYMSPEYVRGRPLDARSDVFGLGVVLWEALTGTRLFRAGTEIETMTRVMSAPAPPPSSVALDLPRELDSVIARALDKSPARRHATMHELAAELEAAARAADLVGSAAEVAAEVDALAGAILTQRRALVRERTQHPGAPPSSAAAALDDDAGSISVTLSDTARTLRAGVSLAGARAPAARNGSGRRAAVVLVAAACVAAAAMAVVAMRGQSAGDHGEVAPPASAPAAPPSSPAVEPPATSPPPPRASPELPAVAPTPSGPARPPPRRGPIPPRPRTGPKPGTPDPNPYGAP